MHVKCLLRSLNKCLPFKFIIIKNLITRAYGISVIVQMLLFLFSRLCDCRGRKGVDRWFICMYQFS